MNNQFRIFIFANLIFLVYLVTLLVNTGFYFVSPFDDSYIFYQYGNRFWDSPLLSYSPQSLPTDGITSKIYFLYSAILTLIFTNPELIVFFNYLTGQILFLVSLLFFYKILFILTDNKKLSLLGTIFFLLSGNIHFAFFSNMDAQFTIFFTILFLYYILKNNQTAIMIISFLFLFLRPEFTLFALLFSFWKIFHNRNLKYILIPSSYIIYLLIKKAYLGSITLNSYIYSTLNSNFFNTLPQLLQQYLNFLSTRLDNFLYFPPYFILIITLLSLSQLFMSGQKKDKEIISVISLFIIIFPLFIIFINYPRASLTLRYLVPVYPLLIINFILIIQNFSGQWQIKITIFTIFLTALFSTKAIYDFAKFGKNLYFSQIAAGQWLEKYANRKDKIMAGDVGAIEFYSQNPLLDIVGLTSDNMTELINEGEGSQWEEIFHLKEKPKFAILFNRLPALENSFLMTPIKTFICPDTKLTRSNHLKIFYLNWKVLNYKNNYSFPFDTKFKVFDQINVAYLKEENNHSYQYLSSPGKKIPSFVKATDNIIDGGRLVYIDNFFIKNPKKKEFFISFRASQLELNIVLTIFINENFYSDIPLKKLVTPKNYFDYCLIPIILKKTPEGKKIKIELRNKNLNLTPPRQVFYYKFYLKGEKR